MDTWTKKLIITSFDFTSGACEYKIMYNIDSTNVNSIINDFEEKITLIKRTPIAKDKIHFLLGCTIPRFKIKNYCEKKKCTVVKHYSNGTIAIYGKNSISEHIVSEAIYSIDFDDFMNCLPKIPHDETTVNLIKTISSENITELGTALWSIHHYLEGQLSVCCDTYRSSSYYTSTDGYDRLKILTSLPYDMIHEDNILEELNSDVVMNKEIYDQIKQLMTSTDVENRKLAMELMANCDYGKSAVYLLLLLKEYGSDIGVTSTKNHVNFKAMLRYFDCANIYERLSLDNILNILKERKLFNPGQLNILMPEVLANFDARSPHYKPSRLVFIDEEGKEVEDSIEQDVVELAIAEETITDNIPEPELSEFVHVIEEEEELECDEIVYDELTEVIQYCHKEGISKYRDKLLNIRALCESPEEILYIIPYFKMIGEFDLESSLMYAYLNMKE